MKRQKEWNDGILEYWENQNLEFWNDGTEKSKIGSMEDRKNRVVPFYGRSVLLSFHSSIVPTFHYSISFVVPSFHHSNIPAFCIQGSL
jgi:hypothetical protein